MLKDLNKLTNEMIKYFVDKIGLDGETIIELNKAPLLFGNPLIDSPGSYLKPFDGQLVDLLKKINLDSKEKKYLLQNGLILINKKFKREDLNKEDLFDLTLSILHEKFHLYRNVLYYSPSRDREDPLSYNGNNLVQNTDKYDFKYGDPNQDIIQGSIDDSKKTVDIYKKKSDEEIEDINFESEEFNEILDKQIRIDEALIELMAYVSYLSYKNKDKNIFEIIENVKNKIDESEIDIKVMCDIILRHHDLKLFEWMLNPLENDDIRFNYFEYYTKNDQDLVNDIFKKEYKIY